MRQVTIVIFISITLAGALGARAQTVAQASELLGSHVASSADGERLGWIAGLLLDSLPRGQHYAILSVRDRDGDDKRFAYPVNALRRGEQGLLLDVPQRNLDASPGYQQRGWPSPRVRAGERYVRARDVIGAEVRDALGKAAGTIEDIVLDLGDGRARAFLVRFPDGRTLPLPAHDVRLSPHGGATLQPDSQRRS